MENVTVSPGLMAHRRLNEIIMKVKDASLFIELMKAALQLHSEAFKDGMETAKNIYAPEPTEPKYEVVAIAGTHSQLTTKAA